MTDVPSPDGHVPSVSMRPLAWLRESSAPWGRRTFLPSRPTCPRDRDRIMVAAPEVVGVWLTQAAHAHGLALALPERVNWRARQVSGAR
jgi:hypothetical protein